MEIKVNNYLLNKKHFEHLKFRNAINSEYFNYYKKFVKQYLNKSLILVNKLNFYNVVFDLNEFYIETNNIHISYADLFKFYFDYFEKESFLHSRILSLLFAYEKLEKEIERIIKNKENEKK